MIVKFVGLGGNAFAPTMLGRYLQHAHPEARVWLIDGKEYQHGHEDHEHFVRTGPKAVVQAGMLHALYPQLTIVPVPLFIDCTNTEHTIAASEAIGEGDYVLLSVDNHETRRLVAEHCTSLQNITLISGAIDATQVHVWLHLRRDGKDLTRAPLARLTDIATAPVALPAAMLQRKGCMDAPADSERPNYFALLTMSVLMLNALWHVLDLAAQGRISEFPYVETWCNVQTATALPTPKEE